MQYGSAAGYFSSPLLTISPRRGRQAEPARQPEAVADAEADQRQVDRAGDMRGLVRAGQPGVSDPLLEEAGQRPAGGGLEGGLHVNRRRAERERPRVAGRVPPLPPGRAQAAQQAEDGGAQQQDAQEQDEEVE